MDEGGAGLQPPDVIAWDLPAATRALGAAGWRVTVRRTEWAGPLPGAGGVPEPVDRVLAARRLGEHGVELVVARFRRGGADGPPDAGA